MYLDVEHDNKVFKADIHSFKGEITNKSIARVSQATEPTDVILSALTSLPMCESHQENTQPPQLGKLDFKETLLQVVIIW